MIRKDGFSIIEILLIIVVLFIVGGVGYMAYNNLGQKTASNVTQNQPTASPVVVKYKKDLDTVDKQLDDLQLDDSETNQLDSSADSF